MDSCLITLAQFDDPVTANIMLSRLETSGIDAVLADENTVGLAWHLNPALGGIRLQVRAEDEEQARLLLEDQPATGVASDTGDTGADDREKMARRAFMAGIIGLMITPLLIYSLVLAVRVATTNGELSPGGRFKAGLIGLLDVLGIAFAVWFFMNLG